MRKREKIKSIKDSIRRLETAGASDDRMVRFMIASYKADLMKLEQK